MSHPEKSKSDTRLLSEKIKGVRVAMLTTIEEDGALRSRPMVTQEAEFDGDLWFFTYANAAKVGDVQQHNQVNLSYEKPNDNLFISVSGTAQLVRDRKKIKELWKPVYKAWFPDGEDDPELALLKVTVTQAEYWSAPAGKAGLLYSVVKSLSSGAKESGGVDVKLNIQ